MTNSSDSEEHVLENSVKSNYQEEGAEDDARKRLGTEAIEQLASGLNLAAHTIEEYSQNVRYFEKFREINLHCVLLVKKLISRNFCCKIFINCIFT